MIIKIKSSNTVSDNEWSKLEDNLQIEKIKNIHHTTKKELSQPNSDCLVLAYMKIAEKKINK